MIRGSRCEVPPSPWIKEINGQLWAEEVPFLVLAERYGTPLHVYSALAIRTAFQSISQALEGIPHFVAYAVKANGNPTILRLLAGLGAWADTVSGGELFWAHRAGIPADHTLMSGVGKTEKEIEFAFRLGIRSLNIESVEELEVVQSVASSLGCQARVGVRLNPHIDPHTHPYIATGIHGTKFGLEIEEAREVLKQISKSPILTLECIASHIGSQITELDAIEESAFLTSLFFEEAIKEGHTPHVLDLGGGWPLAYGDEESSVPSHRAFGQAIRRGIEKSGWLERAQKHKGLFLVVEPGRAIVGEGGALLTRVLFVKRSPSKRFVIVDAAMTELIRPALYGAYHAVVPVINPARPPLDKADIVGPVCETGDFFALNRPFPEVKRGELLILRSTGAYGAAMSSEYNGRPKAAEVMVDGSKAHLIRPRGKWEDLHVDPAWPFLASE
ncbi:MAG: diaminopimelate decarboxylase [Deltaproteobacteria bacterium]|nr:diaminopimelate decarboxylase [Deltaproteobacteria bacterium]